VSLLSVEHVTKRFGGLVAVRDVSFELNSGEILGLIGQNGAGKTTVFNMISGHYTPDEGSITFEGRRIDGLRPSKICRCGIGRTFQLVKPFLTETVLENVLLAASFGHPGGDSVDDLVGKAISLTGLEEYRNSLVGSLPFIQRRKVEVARALATGGRLLLLDEPMAGLNPVEVQEFVEIMCKICAQGVTVLLIEHVVHAIMRLSSRIIVMDHGEKIAEGTPAEVSNNERVLRAYFGE